MINLSISSINKNSIHNYKKRFLLDYDEETAKKKLIDKINENYNTWFGYFLDGYHESEMLHKLFERK